MIGAFVAECVDYTDPDALADLDEIVDVYLEWCDQRGLRPTGCQRLVDLFALRTVPDAHNPRRRLVRGVKRQTSPPSTPNPPASNGSTSATPNLDRIRRALRDRDG